jgi:hypothetical protein
MNQEHPQAHKIQRRQTNPQVRLKKHDKNYITYFSLILS